MNPDATGFDDPQAAGKLMMLKRFDQLAEQDFKQLDVIRPEDASTATPADLSGGNRST